MRIKRKRLMILCLFLLSCVSIGYASLKTKIKNTLNATVKPIPMIMEYNANHEFFSTTFSQRVKNLYFDDQIDIPYNAIGEWDISVNQDRGVMAYYVANAEDSTMYDLYIEGDGALYANYNSNHALSGFEKLVSINSLEKLSTSLTTNMSYMFANLTSLTSMDASSLDTSKVTDASYLFYCCSSLTSIGDTSGWTFPKVTTTAYAFYYCPQLISLVTTNWDFSENKDMSWMFYGDTALMSLGDESQWNLRKVTTMYRTFYQLKLERLNGENWGLDSLENMTQTFHNMMNLTIIENTGNWNLSKLTTMEGAFYYCNKLTKIDGRNWNLNSLINFSQAFFHNDALTVIENTTNWNLSNVENMKQTFYACGKLDFLDTTNWRLGKVTTMYQTFYNDYSLSSMGDTNGWTLESLQNMGGAFNGCSKLTTLGTASWNTANVTDFSSTFLNMLELVDMDISKLNFENVSDVNNMFSNCHVLSGTLNLNALNLTSAPYMFNSVSHNNGEQIVLNYTANNEGLVDSIIASKYEKTNLVKGSLIT